MSTTTPLIDHRFFPISSVADRMSSFFPSASSSAHHHRHHHSQSYHPDSPDHARLSYELITPQYSPDTVTAITLRHFEKQSKQQAEREYDVENGLLPPPPPDDDPTIPSAVRAIHKKKRKVRSAIVSRRKTAIYVQKLEEELDNRQSLNDRLKHRLASYRHSLDTIHSQIDALETATTAHNPHNNNNNTNNNNNSSNSHSHTNNNNSNNNHHTSTPRRERHSPAIADIPFPPPTATSSHHYHYQQQNQEHHHHNHSSSSSPSFPSAAIQQQQQHLAEPPPLPAFEPPIEPSELNSALGFGYVPAPAQQPTPLAPLTPAPFTSASLIPPSVSTSTTSTYAQQQQQQQQQRSRQQHQHPLPGAVARSQVVEEEDDSREFFQPQQANHQALIEDDNDDDLDLLSNMSLAFAQKRRQEQQQQEQQQSQQQRHYASVVDKAFDSADFSECSDRNISPSVRPAAPPSQLPANMANLPPVLNALDRATAALVGGREMDSWRQTTQVQQQNAFRDSFVF